MFFWGDLINLGLLKVGTMYVFVSFIIVKVLIIVTYSCTRKKAYILSNTRIGIQWRAKIGYFIFVTVLLFFIANHVDAQQQIIDELREYAKQEIGPDRLGASYAAMINFAVNPDISTAVYNIQVDSADEPQLNEYRLPFRYVFKLDDNSWRPLIQLNLAYQSQKAGFGFLEDESVNAEWQIYGGSLAIGAEIPAGKHFVIISALDAGVVRIKSSADYYGVLADLLFRPALDGLVFNWEANAWLMGATVGVDCPLNFNTYDLRIYSSLTHNYIETYDSSSGLIEFGTNITTFHANVDATFPTKLSFSGFPLSLVLTAGNTTFLGPNRDALDFQYFFENGLGIEMDISIKNWLVKKVQLGAKIIYGEDVSGWGFIISPKF